MPENEELIAAAKDAIGNGQPDQDWKVTPTEHAALLGGKAPSLAKVLGGTRALGQAGRYEELNKRAVEARDRFKETVTRANWAIFVTASLGALLLIKGTLHGLFGGWDQRLVTATGVVGLLSGGLAAMWLTQVQQGKLADAWTKTRAQAEAKRLAYFKDVMAGAPKEPQSQLFALEYVRRYLLDNQIDYFRQRGDQHEKIAKSALTTFTRAVFVASTSTALAGLLSAAIDSRWAAIAGIGVVASAFGALAASQSAVNRDRKNADSYRLAQDALEERKLDLDAYRARAADGEQGVLEQFFEPVFVALAADHKAWLEDAEMRDLAIGDMAKRLDAAKKVLESRPGPAPGGSTS